MQKDLITLMVPIEKEKSEKSDTSGSINLNFGSLVNDGSVLPTIDESTQEEPKRKKKNNTRRKINTDTGEESSSTFSETEPYTKQYVETTAKLKEAIAQVDMSLGELQSDVNLIRSSRTLKKKYDYIAMMQGTMGQFINTKVTALREINNTITKCNELELRRAKDLKMAESQQNDDKTIMDMYNAFIHTPVSTGMSLGPNMQDVSMNNIPINTSYGNDADEIGYQNYLNNLNPAQKLMMYENDPDVKQVVMYDESTGARWFEIMNMRTNEIIQGADKHDMMFMEDTVLDLNNDIAKNLNMGETYPIVRVGNSVVNNY